MRFLIPTLIAVAAPALADPVPYALDRARSAVAFTFEMVGQDTQGTMPVTSADIALDLDDLAQSTARVMLDASGATTSIGFATEAMLGPQVLATDRFPTIQFEATRLSGSLAGGTIEGRVTIRGITRPITLDAQVFRQRDTIAGDRSRLSVLMTGTVDRRDFGADGFAQFVGPKITLEILTRLDRR